MLSRDKQGWIQIVKREKICAVFCNNGFATQSLSCQKILKTGVTPVVDKQNRINFFRFNISCQFRLSLNRILIQCKLRIFLPCSIWHPNTFNPEFLNLLHPNTCRTLCAAAIASKADYCKIAYRHTLFMEE